jgi:hypothetical protein
MEDYVGKLCCMKWNQTNRVWISLHPDGVRIDKVVRVLCGERPPIGQSHETELNYLTTNFWVFTFNDT